jgi:hypothetical protein
MKKQLAIKQLTLALAVLATLFIANLEITLDHHDLDNLPLSACPVFEISHVLSYVEYSLQVWSVPVSYCLAEIQCPVAKSFAQKQVCSSSPLNRAHPNMDTV